MGYVYQHIRLDKNEPFYIGVSKKNNNYKRSREFRNRNNLWKKIYNKTNIKVEIIFEANDMNLVYKKEKELIKLYGRLNNNTGILSNFSDGGEINTGIIPTQETIDKMKNTKSIKYYVYSTNGTFIETIKGLYNCKIKYGSLSRNLEDNSYFNTKYLILKTKINNFIDYCKYISYNKNGDIAGYYYNIYSLKNYLPLSKKSLNNLLSHLNNERKSFLGFRWFKKDRFTMYPLKLNNFVKNKNSKIIYQYDLNNNFINRYNSARECEKETSVGYKLISAVCNGNKKTAHGFIFSFTPKHITDVSKNNRMVFH